MSLLVPPKKEKMGNGSKKIIEENIQVLQTQLLKAIDRNYGQLDYNPDVIMFTREIRDQALVLNDILAQKIQSYYKEQ